MEAFATESFSLSPALKDFISGAVAGAFAITVAQPLDTVRVRLQQGALLGGPKQNTISILVGMMRTEGLLSPLKGLTYPLVFASIQGAIIFQAYGWTLRELATSKQKNLQPSHEPQPAQTCRTGPVLMPSSNAGPASPPAAATTKAAAAAAAPPPALAASFLPTGSESGPKSICASGSESSGAPPARPSTLHDLHLHYHHHHHYLYEQQAAAVHGSTSFTGRVLSWVADRLGLPSGSIAASSRGVGESPAGIRINAGAAEGGGASSAGPDVIYEGDPSCSSSSNVSSRGGSDVSSSGGGGGSGDVRGDGSLHVSSGSGVSAFVSTNGCQQHLGISSRGPGSGDLAHIDSNSSTNSCSSNGKRSCGSNSGGGDNGELAVEVPQAHRQMGSKQQQEQQQQSTPMPTPWQGFLAGGVAGTAQVFLWSPVELLKLRAQLQTATPGSVAYRNPAALAVQVLRQDGVGGLYRGFTLTLLRDAPSYAVYFWMYHDIAGMLSPGVHTEQAPPSTQVLAGGLAGVMAWMSIYPLDTLKARMQAVTASASQGKTWLHFAQQMYREDGVRAFYRGVAPTLVRAFIMDAAAFLGYTTTLKILGGGTADESA